MAYISFPTFECMGYFRMLKCEKERMAYISLPNVECMGYFKRLKC